MAKNRLVGVQPTVLKASTIEMDCDPDDMIEALTASMTEVFRASTRRSRLAVTSLSSTVAVALPRTRLVAMIPPMARDLPWPVIELPPEDDAVTSTSERMTPDWRAWTVTSRAVTSIPVIEAVASLVTSLRTMTAPRVAEGDSAMLKPAGSTLVTGTARQLPRSE